MADNTANIRVTANEQEVDQLSRSVDELNQDLRQTERQAEKTERSVDGLDRAVQGLNAAANVASAGMDGMRAAAEIARRAFEVVGEAVRVFAEESEEGARIVGALETSFRNLQVELGRAVIATEGGQEAVRILIGLFNSLQSAVVANQDQIGDLASNGARTLVNGIDVMGQALIQFENIWTGLSIIADTFFVGVGNAFRIVSAGINVLMVAISGVLGTVAEALAAILRGAELAARAVGMSGLAGEIGDAERALSGFANTAFNRASQEMQAAGENIMAGVDTTMSALRGVGDRIVSSANFENSINDLLARINNQISTAVIQGPTISMGGGDGDDEGDVLASILGFGGALAGAAGSVAGAVGEQANKLAEAQEAALMRRNELRRLADEELLEQQRLAYEAQQALAEEAQERRERLQQRGVEAIVSLNNSLLSIEGKNAKERRRALRQALGNEMVTKGQALIAEAAATAIANPARAVALGIGGTALVAAGTKFAAGGGGGGGGRTAPPRQSITNQNVVFNQQTQFGFVGDRRAATREIEDLNRASIERGLT